MERRIRALEFQIEKVKRELGGLGDLHPGSLSEQYNVCGNPNCRCKETPPEKAWPLLPAQLHAERKKPHEVREATASVPDQETVEKLRPAS